MRCYQETRSHPMDKDIARRWIDALRSGKYQQTTGTLRSPDGSYCCLGVLCEIEGLKYDEDRRTFTFTDEEGETDHSDTLLPDTFAKHLGIHEEGLLKNKRRMPVVSLIQLNDVNKASFSEIADVIENAVFSDDPDRVFRTY